MGSLALAWLFVACGAGSEDEPLPVAEVQTLQERIGEPDLMSIDDIKAHRDDLARRMRTDPDPRVRADIAAALGYTARDVDSIPALAQALATETDIDVQRRLVAVLVSFAREDATAAVVDFALGSVHPDLEQDVHGALIGCDPSQVGSALAAREASRPQEVARLRADLCVLLPSASFCQE